MSSWPDPVAGAALHGPAGEFVLRTEPHSEAHPMALLAQFLVAFGTACGRGAHYQVEADRHYSNEFIVLVGPTATGRKGSSWGHVRRLLQEADAAFERCLAGGLSSGDLPQLLLGHHAKLPYRKHPGALELVQPPPAKQRARERLLVRLRPLAHPQHHRSSSDARSRDATRPSNSPGSRRANASTGSADAGTNFVFFVRR